MASAPGSRGKDQPPALPVKQHRLSSVESDSVMFSPVGLQPQYYIYNDVFTEPTDCNAAQCPIHQRYDPSIHQLRFFSDGTPPPVPKKRLARTLSLPVPPAPQPSPLSPLSPLQRHPKNFDNPLYMLAPIPDTYFQEEEEEFKPGSTSPIPPLSFSQLSFDTPDEHLPGLFSSFDDHRVVSQGIQRRQLLFLRSMAQTMEAGILLQREPTGSSYQPQDFLLCEGSEPKQIGDTVYYSLQSPKLPGRMLALRVHRQSDEASSTHTKQQPSHVNVQELIAHFQPSGMLRNDSSILQAHNPSHPCYTAAIPPGGGITECATAHVNFNLSSVQAFLQKGFFVSVERDLPNATLEDFVQESTDCLGYDKHVCAVLLQILMGSQHLYNISATAAELTPQGIFLVWPGRQKEEGETELEHDDSEMKRCFKTSRWNEEMEKAETKGKIQILLRTHGSPRVVLTPLSSALSAAHPLIHIKTQIGALIHYCLHSSESLAPPGSGPNQSSYRRGLFYLASLLESESSGAQMADMVVVLQVLLWGPRVPLSNHRGSMITTVHNWLTIKRALLVMKLAERGLIQDQSALDWEDCMCLQYLSFIDPETVESIPSLFWLPLNMDIKTE